MTITALICNRIKGLNATRVCTSSRLAMRHALMHHLGTFLAFLCHLFLCTKTHKDEYSSHYFLPHASLWALTTQANDKIERQGYFKKGY